jgi:hypothetical protein
VPNPGKVVVVVVTALEVVVVAVEPDVAVEPEDVEVVEEPDDVEDEKADLTQRTLPCTVQIQMNSENPACAS